MHIKSNQRKNHIFFLWKRTTLSKHTLKKHYFGVKPLTNVVVEDEHVIDIGKKRNEKSVEGNLNV